METKKVIVDGEEIELCIVSSPDEYETNEIDEDTIPIDTEEIRRQLLENTQVINKDDNND